MSSSIEKSPPVLYRGRFTGDTWLESSVCAVLVDSLALCIPDGVGGGGGAARGDVYASTGSTPGEGLLEERAGGPVGTSRMLREVGDSMGLEMVLPLTVGPVFSVSRADTEDIDRSGATPGGAVGVVGPEPCAEGISFLDRADFIEFCSESPRLGRSTDGRELESARVG